MAFVYDLLKPDSRLISALDDLAILSELLDTELGSTIFFCQGSRPLSSYLRAAPDFAAGEVSSSFARREDCRHDIWSPGLGCFFLWFVCLWFLDSDWCAFFCVWVVLKGAVGCVLMGEGVRMSLKWKMKIHLMQIWDQMDYKQ